MIHHRQAVHFVLVIILAFSWFGTITGFTRAKEEDITAATLPPEEYTPTVTLIPPGIKLVETEIVTLPLVEQNSGARLFTPVVDSLILQETAVPGSQGPSPTPTSTPLPPQTGATNLPIVIGATGIYLIIILAWLLVGWRPRRHQDL